MRIRAGGHMIAVLYRRADTRKLQGGFTGMMVWCVCVSLSHTLPLNVVLRG